jgi:hypothetical protein
MKLPSLQALRQDNKRRHRETLNFMQEWTNDLMERESELEQQRQQHFARVIKEHKQDAQEDGERLNLERLIKEEFLKKMESLYLKQLMVANLSHRSHPHDAPQDLEDSLNRSQQTYTEEQHYFDKDHLSSHLD